MGTSPHGLVAMAVVGWSSVGCSLPAAVRSGEITRSPVAVEAALPIVAYEPQTSVDDDHVTSTSKVSFSPMPIWSVRGRLSRCELGGALMMRDIVEARCGVLQESEGAPFSIAPSVAGGYNIFPGGAWIRGGIDVSRRFGVVTPMVNAYLSYGPELHWMQRKIVREDDPREGPIPPSVQTARRELRLSIPFGLAFRVVNGEVWVTDGLDDDGRTPKRFEDHAFSWDIVFGATAWWVLKSTVIEQRPLTYDADRGMTFTLGFQLR